MDIYVAGLVGGVAAFIVGGLWYGPLFGSQYQSGTRSLKVAPLTGHAMVLMLVLNIVAALGVAALYASTSLGDEGITGGLLLGGLVWAISMAVFKGHAISLHLPRAITWVTGSYQLVAFLIYGVVASLFLA